MTTKPKDTKWVEEKIKEFGELDYLFHNVVDGEFCWGDKIPIFDTDEETTAGRKIIGYKVGVCNCGGEKKKQKVRAFLRLVLTQTQQDTLEWCLKEVVGEDEVYSEENRFANDGGDLWGDKYARGLQIEIARRNVKRAKQRQTIKKKMEDLK